MSTPLGRIPRGWLVAGSVLALLLVALALVPVAHDAMFGTRRPYDDEGYMLLKLRDFIGGANPYGYSGEFTYGPGFFVAIGGLLGALPVDLTNDGVRFFNLVAWMAAAMLAGLALLVLTRNLPIAAAGLVISFLLLSPARNEPLHPGAVIALLLSAMVLAAALLPRRPAYALGAIGALVALLLSIKVNVGVLALGSIGVAAVITAPWARRVGALRIGVCALMVVLPLLLVRDNLDQVRGLRYAGVVSLGALAFVLIALRLPPDPVPWRHVKSFGLAGGFVLAVAIGVLFVRGSTPGELLEGTVLTPLKFDQSFFLQPGLAASTWLWGIAGLVAAWLIRRRLATERKPSNRALAAEGAARMAVGLLVWIYLARPAGQLDAAAIPVGASLAWVAAVPAGEAPPETPFVRALIPSLAILQLLHAYPVAGSQLGWSEFLLVIAGGVCIGDGVHQLSRYGSSRRPGFRAWPAVASAGVVLFAAWLCLGPLSDFARRSSERYEEGLALDLPGAQRERVDPLEAAALEGLVADIRARCRSFLSIPAMNSLYLYSSQAPPAGVLMGPWMWLVDDERQRQIVERLRGQGGLCVVRNRSVIAIWENIAGPMPSGPLVRFIEEDFEVPGVWSLAPYVGYELLVPKRSDSRQGPSGTS